jgi:hypothetical protein
MELWITQISGRSFSVISLEAGLKQSPWYAAVWDLYFHCKKSDPYIWQLSTGPANFGTVPPASHQ